MSNDSVNSGKVNPNVSPFRGTQSRYGKNAQTQNPGTTLGNTGGADLGSTKSLKRATCELEVGMDNES